MKLVILTLLACVHVSCVSAIPSPGDTREDLPKVSVARHVFHRRILANGLHALAVRDKGENASVFVVIGAGKRQETPETTGLAHLTEHAMYTGTPTTGADEHDRIIKEMGGQSNAFTREDYTLFYDHEVPVDRLDQVLAMEADRLRNITFDEEAVLKERDRLRIEEEETYQIAMALEEKLESVVFQHHGYRAGLLDENRHTLAPTLGVSLVRDFYDLYYQTDNTAVVVVGAVDPGAALDAIEAAYGGLPRGPERPPIEGEPDVLEPRTERIESRLTRDRWEHVWLTPAQGHPDRLRLDALGRILSRRTRADGSAFSASMGTRVDRDLFRVAATGPDAAGELDRLLEQVRAAGVDGAELEEVKRLLRDDLTSLPLRGEPYFSLAGFVAIAELFDDIDSLARYPSDVQALAPAGILAAARTHLDPSRRIAVVFEGTGEADTPLPDEQKALETAAELAVFAGDYDRAIAAYTKLLASEDLTPFYTVIYLRERGVVHMKKRDYAAAEADFVATLERFPWPEVEDLLEEVRALREGEESDDG